MKVRTNVGAGLILGIILTSFLVAPVCANDNNLFASENPLNTRLWGKTTSTDVSTFLPDNSGILSFVKKSSDIENKDNQLFNTISQNPILEVGKMIAKHTDSLEISPEICLEVRPSLIKSYNNSDHVHITHKVTIPPDSTEQPVYPSGSRFTSKKPISMNTRPSYTPSSMVIVVPTPTPTHGDEVSDPKSGICLTEFNLQDKYIKITNTGINSVIMTGWKITNSQDNSLTFIDFPLVDGSVFTYVLNPFSALTIYFGKEGMFTGTEMYYPGIDFWNPHGDTALLYNPQGVLVGSIRA